MSARVAVLNDDLGFLELMGTILEDGGYEAQLIRTAQTGSVEVVAAYDPDLIILDLYFGHAAVGWEILAGIRAHPALATIPVILCTAAKKDLQDRAATLQAQNTWYLEKPFNLEDINNLISALVVQRGEPPT